MTFLLRVFLISTLAFVLSACGPASPSFDRFMTQDQVSHGAWGLSGVMSIQHGRKRVLAHYHWTHSLKRDVIDVSGTFHIAATKIIITASGASLIAADGRHYTAPNADELMKEHLGWSLPMRSLTYWVRGLVAPGSAAIGKQRNKGDLMALTQLGWQLHWYSYHTVGHLRLPKLMTLQKGKWSFRVAFNRWS